MKKEPEVHRASNGAKKQHSKDERPRKKKTERKVFTASAAPDEAANPPDGTIE
jgi:hypothetical protein